MSPADSQLPIGIVVNPASGKDVRRLIARASVFDNREKSAIVKRALSGAISAGANHFAFMDDSHNIAGSAFDELTDDVAGKLKLNRVGCPKTATALDTQSAATALADLGAIAVLVLGGDGTSRAFVKGWRDAVLLAVSTGTNNVFPQLTEATIAGAALGLIAANSVELRDVASPVKIIDVDIDGEEPEIALIDAVITSERFIGARALLDGEALKCALLTRAEPAAVGITSVGGLVHPLAESEPYGLLVTMGEGERSVRAPIAPGLYQDINIASAQTIELGEAIELSGPCVIALDGERERLVKPGQKFSMRISRTGPSVININKTMQLAACSGAFVSEQAPVRH